VKVGGGGGVSSHPWRSAAAAAHPPHFGGDGGVGISTGVGRRRPAEGTILHMKLCFVVLLHYTSPFLKAGLLWVC